MEKGKRIEVEFALPEALIQHIQSFLSGKEAAQTSVLSKYWYGAWCTRPNLDFDQRHFGDEKGFWKFAKKTVKRYRELNRKIESFSLSMKGTFPFNNAEHYSYALANELILKAMEMGAIDLNFEICWQNKAFALPKEVLGSETLIRLSVKGCKIELGVDGKISCSRLKSLSLRNVYIKGDHIIWDIISRCPLIEDLSLSECKFLLESHHSSDVRMLALSPFIEFGKRNVGSVVDGPIHLYEFHKLKCLFLGRVEIHTLFFRDFSSRFPCLKDLTVYNCSGYNYKGIRISSCSLECVSFSQKRMLRAFFDFPSIRKFQYSGSSLPSLSFQTASREWESDISIMCGRPSASWFLKLKNLLINLSPSKVSLTLDIGSIRMMKSFDDAGVVQCLPKPVVENLTMRAESWGCSAIWDSLFWICRPMFITQYWFSKSYSEMKANKGLEEFLCKRLTQVSENCCIPNENMLGQCNLQEVNVEIFEETVAEWRPIPFKTLLDVSASSETNQKIRFQLRWG